MATQRIPTAPDLDTLFFRLRTPALQFRRVQRSCPSIVGTQVIKLSVDTISLLPDQIASNDWEYVWPRAWIRITRRWMPLMKRHGGDLRDLEYGMPIISRRQPVPWRIGVIERDPNAREQPYLLWSLLRQRIRQMHQNANCYDSSSPEGSRFLYLLSLSKAHQPRPVHQVWSTEPVQLSLWQQQELS
ncbi:hypothetical protein [Dictyobacter formicarum]|uniref:hypothetical protein n=1 Tax=Dictyobacter formicarum TaxID=2778368 RepID=UPI0019160E39|nr:hypothetical protein [Dictyobacter formicarum]